MYSQKELHITQEDLAKRVALKRNGIKKVLSVLVGVFVKIAIADGCRILKVELSRFLRHSSEEYFLENLVLAIKLDLQSGYACMP